MNKLNMEINAATAYRHMYVKNRIKQIPMTSPIIIESLRRRVLIMDRRLLMPGIVSAIDLSTRL